MATHDLIRRARIALKMTEQQLADKLGVSRGAVQHWEREDGTAPSRRNQQAVADALKLTVAELVLGQSDKYQDPPKAAEPPAAYKVERAPENLQKQAATLFSLLDGPQQAAAIAYLRFLLEQQRNP
jgi:transcriptional regulator with XRE-family HTH domain